MFADEMWQTIMLMRRREEGRCFGFLDKLCEGFFVVSDGLKIVTVIIVDIGDRSDLEIEVEKMMPKLARLDDKPIFFDERRISNRLATEDRIKDQPQVTFCLRVDSVILLTQLWDERAEDPIGDREAGCV